MEKKIRRFISRLQYISNREDIKMSEHKKVGEIKGLKFIGGQITSRIQADEGHCNA